MVDFTGISELHFLIPGNFEEENPRAGLERTLDLIAEGEKLGYAGAWVRQRHLERGVSSAAVFLAAATQRTTRIKLGTAVIQLGYETPFRLAEDLAMVDVLSGGRLQVGVSAGPPPFGPLLGDLLYDGDPERIDYSHARAERLAWAIRAEPLHKESLAGNAASAQIPRLQPVAQGLADRLWYGGGSLKSAAWAGRAGFRLLGGNIVTGERTEDFLTAQNALLDAFQANWRGSGPAPEAGLGRVILPTDSASPATRRRYVEFAASRDARTRAPQGERRTLFLPDIVGSTEEIAERLRADSVVSRVSSLRLELPYEFEAEDYAQILHDGIRLRGLLAPERKAEPLGA
ncbi:LLM class flavin-dependent oxidoreductase [Neomegalonema sp.]|uniref:LLM class flavin-dependent oxidoreductase n=1 Tax=Neomegalonema sp. TaxID=2039713 RepID=UPI002606F5C1|nr:LLM class flavin-dependent oxidoreductase [Neomegalonema sp.]MDD2867399.1 LLM class flavin-dependent oxidoreductase [Neomegalonema sp.]